MKRGLSAQVIDAHAALQAEARKLVSVTALSSPDELAEFYGPLLAERVMKNPVLKDAALLLICAQVIDEYARRPGNVPIIKAKKRAKPKVRR